MEAYWICFSGSVAVLVGCGPAGAEEDVEEGAILRTHRRRVLERMMLLREKITRTCAAVIQDLQYHSSQERMFEASS